MILSSKIIDYQTVIEWDVPTWKRAIFHWEGVIARKNSTLSYGLELGSRNGGLSYYFAKKYGAKVCCSDYGFPSEKAKELHKRERLGGHITYHNIDATNIPFSEATFDFVVFKSVLGAIGSKGNFNNIIAAVNEIHRVLKPNGILFFAENLKGNSIHQLGRSLFISWGKSWYYLSIGEIDNLLKRFNQKEIYSTGICTAFLAKPSWLKNIVANFDEQCKFLPDSWKYVAFGHAVK